MFLKTGTMRSTEEFLEQVDQLKQAIADADAVVIGAGAGLSVSAGFAYSGERFRRYFEDFEEKYGFHDMYSGGFYPYSTPEEHWAYWSRYVHVNRYMDPPKPVYEMLRQLMENKDYFVITTNVDHCFQKSGFDKKRLFYTQGDYGLFQCSGPCRQETFDNENLIRRMVEHQRDMRIPSGLVPRCPYCGKPLVMNLRCDDKFVEDAGWHRAARQYENFLRASAGGRILFLELGVGYNTPSIIKYPFWRMTAAEPKAVYGCINLGGAAVPEAIKARSISINSDIGSILEALV